MMHVLTQSRLAQTCLSRTGLKWFVFTVLSLGFIQSTYSMFDSRYGVPPITERPYFRRYRKYHFACEPFLMLAGNSYSSYSDNQGLFDIYGGYDLYQLDEALRLAGKISTTQVRPDWNATMIPYCLDGMFASQGINFVGRAYLFDCLCIGFKLAYIHARAAAQYNLDTNRANFRLQGPGDEYDLNMIKNSLHTIGLFS